MMRWTLVLLVLPAVVGCLDPGEPDYSSHVGVRTIEEEIEFLPGPNPFVDFVPRLEFSIFYEGDATDEITINDIDTHYYIFDNTYRQETSTERVEGTLSDLLILNGGGYYGGGIIYDSPRNLSDWTTMHISLRASDATFVDIPITVISGTSDVNTDHTVIASNYGYANDGEWHSLVIPLSDFPGFDATSVISPFVISAPGNNAGDQLWIDDLYYTQEAP
jgi:hypothetical protein